MMRVKRCVLNFWIDILLNIPNIGEHSLVVGEISWHVAKEFFKDDEKAYLAKAGGILHDIGYIIPRFSPKLYEVQEVYSILDYFQNSKELDKIVHTNVGGFILSNFIGLSGFADIAQFHHTPAQDLDPHELSHIMANIVGLADLVSIYVEKADPSVAREVALDVIDSNKDNFFPEVYEAAKVSLSKEIVWWIIQDPETSYLSYEIGDTSPLKVEDLEDMGHFTSYIVDSKSIFTRKHSEGVAILAREMAKELLLPPETQEKIYVAGLFHDIGKMAIDTSILEKPGPLTKKEYWMMKKHVFYTRKFLRHFVEAGQEWPAWAWQHHERLDGSGYPEKLTADDMSIESRILQVADVFTAFTEDRPYRESMKYEDALSIIEKEVEKGRMDFDVFKSLENLVKNGYTLPEKTMVEFIVESVKFLVEALEG